MSLLEKMDCNVFSYILGDPNPISGISVDDGTSAPVAANLLQATLSVFVDGVSLVSSRVVSSDGTDRIHHSIWIDAVCVTRLITKERVRRCR